MIKINTLVIKNAHIVSPADGLDKVADVLVKDGKITKIAENIRNIEPPSSRTKQYVITMVDNRVTDMLRAKGRHPTEEYNDALQTALSASEDGEAYLVTCILKLPERQRMVIWLKYYYGYTLREIASMLDISLVSAQKEARRAL